MPSITLDRNTARKLNTVSPAITDRSVNSTSLISPSYLLLRPPATSQDSWVHCTLSPNMTWEEPPGVCIQQADTQAPHLEILISSALAGILLSTWVTNALSDSYYLTRMSRIDRMKQDGLRNGAWKLGTPLNTGFKLTEAKLLSYTEPVHWKHVGCWGSWIRQCICLAVYKESAV